MFASGKAAAVSSEANYIEDVFSTYLFETNTPSDVTVPNGIDLSGEGGLVWNKCRNDSFSHQLYDTNRGGSYQLQSNTTNAQSSYFAGRVEFGSDGFVWKSSGGWSTNSFVSWTFRKQPKFFDVVTYTGTGSVQNISHNLGSAPACMIVKDTTNAGSAWAIYHTSLGNTQYLQFTTSAAGTSSGYWNNTSPTSTQFTVGTNGNVNQSGATYVAYLFAHNAGGFGLTGTDNVISCGSFTPSGGVATVNLGFEPQWILSKTNSSGYFWRIVDNMRGIPVSPAGSNSAKVLYPNSSNAEASSGDISPTATGFTVDGQPDFETIYIAIRRGPMKVPTSGTSVFAPVAYTGTNVDNRLVDTGIVTDMTMARIRTATSNGGFYTADRLRGDSSLGTAITDAENTDADSFMTPTVGYGISFSAMNGFGVGNDVTRQLNQSSTDQLAYAFQRAPNFFDVVCYTGNSTIRTITHNLGVAPELMIVKKRSATASWPVYLSATTLAYLDLTDAQYTGVSQWNSTAPTSTVFTVATSNEVNGSGSTYVAYLFATCAGVSKVGSYTGNGSTQTIDCGFTGGARFVLIKRTDSTGNWYVWDTARGMVAGTDPKLALDSTAAESNANWVYTTTGGFEIVTSNANVNASGGTYIYLAIA